MQDIPSYTKAGYLNHIVLLHLLGNEVHVATIRGDIDTLTRLVRTESLDLPGRSFQSALHAAADIGCQTTVAWLLEQGAEMNHIQGNPLQAAVERGHDEVVRLLLDAGANANLATGEYGGTLLTAIFLERLVIVDLLTKKDPTLFRQRSAYGSALDIAACRKNKNTRMLVTLVRAGADVAQGVPDNGSPIDGAVICGYQENVRTLLELGFPCEQGLKLAIQRRKFGIARLILDLEPTSLERITTDQWSPLICAAQNDDYRMVLLILRKVRPTFRSTLLERTETWRGLTPLDCARRAGLRKITRLLEATLEHKDAVQITYRSKRKKVSGDDLG